MNTTYSGLEASVTDIPATLYQTTNRTSFNQGLSPYRSQSEQIIAGILEKADISFGYEDALYVSTKYSCTNSGHTWHPDFYLRDLGVIVEYVGMTDNKEYMEGIERKREVYDRMGVTVIWLYPEDLWEQTANHKYGKLRADAEENILRKISAVK